MIHIKETEIIPLLKEAQTECSQKITEGDPQDVEMAERIEEALTQAMDIVYDYQSMTDEHKLCNVILRKYRNKLLCFSIDFFSF